MLNGQAPLAWVWIADICRDVSALSSPAPPYTVRSDLPSLSLLKSRDGQMRLTYPPTPSPQGAPLRLKPKCHSPKGPIGLGGKLLPCHMFPGRGHRLTFLPLGGVCSLEVGEARFLACSLARPLSSPTLRGPWAHWAPPTLVPHGPRKGRRWWWKPSEGGGSQDCAPSTATQRKDWDGN